MVTSSYSPTVTFDDPLNSFAGVDKYRNNVDMLAGRTPMGGLLFEDAGISLHSVTGGEVRDDGSVCDIVTRWSLRVTAKVLPWKPTARFTGISVYTISPIDGKAIITGQADYWDSINLRDDGSGSYNKVDMGTAVSDFLEQLKPGGFMASQAGAEVPYELLRRGDGYEVRRYPEMAVVSLPYSRRDEGFGSLGAFTRGLEPLSPAIMTVPSSSTSNKRMSWPLSFSTPSNPTPFTPPAAVEKAGQGQWRTISVQNIPSRTIAVRIFEDASMEPVVRKADRELRVFLKRDGLVAAAPVAENEGEVMFAQYDAIFSMGKRRGEVWIELEEGGHPWSQ